MQEAYRLHPFAILFKARRENFYFGHHLLLFANAYLENHTVCANVIHTKRLLYYRATAFSGLKRRVSYEWQAMASKLSPMTITFSFGHFWGFWHVFRAWQV